MEWIRQVEDHWAACMATAGNGGRFTRVPGGRVLLNGTLTGPLVNFLSLRGALSAGALAEVLEFAAALFLEQGRIPALYLAPEPGSARDLEVELGARGWVQVGRQQILLRSLAELPALPEIGAQARRAPPAEYGAWVRLLTRAHDLTGDRGRQVRRAWGSLLHARHAGTAAVPVWGMQGERRVGTGLVWVQGALALLACGAVLLGFRRLGTETATLRFRLREAAALGADHAYLQTEPGSPVSALCTERLGFQVAYTRSVWFPLGPGTVVKNLWI